MWRRLTRSLAASETEQWEWWETAALVGFIATVAKGIRWHEGWADEAQAWLIARDMGWWDMMLHGLHHEGSPGLWHTLLWILARLHFSYIGMHYVAGLIAVAGAAVFLRYAPFPRYLKLLLPFTFYIAYQDAVVARNYVLYTLLGFIVVALLRRRADRPILLAVLLGLIANISFHGAAASAGMALVVLVQARRSGTLDRRYMGAALILLAFWAISLGTGKPPADQDFAISKLNQKERIWVKDAQGRGHWLWQRDQIPVDPDPDKPHIVTREEAATSTTMQPGELAPIPFNIPHRKAGLRWQLKIASVLGTFTFPLSESRLIGLSLVIMLIVLACYKPDDSSQQNEGWIGLAPYAAIALPFSILYIAPRHSGMLFTSFLISAWLIWPREHLSRRAAWPQVTMTVLLLLMTLEQIGWTRYAVHTDKHQPYSGDWATAHFLKTLPKDKTVAGFTYHATGALAYLDHFKYVNQPHSYWIWSNKVRISQNAPAVLATHPDYVVVGGFTFGSQGDMNVDWAPRVNDLPYMPMADAYRIRAYFLQNGYVERDRFCGRLLMRAEYSEEVCDIILEYQTPED